MIFDQAEEAGGSVERIIEVMNLLGRYGFVFVTLQHPVKITQLPLKSHMHYLKLRRLVMFASIVDCMGRIEFAERFEKRLALIDDDVQFRPGDISRLFDYCDNENIELCQPALCWGTNASHNVTLWNPLFNRRNVTFIEVMTPFFSIDMLNQLMPTFNLTKSTYGIDYAWSSILSGGGKIAIVDKIKVNHIKAIDQKKDAFYNYLRAMGVDAFEDYEGVKELYGFEDGFKTLREDHVFRWFIPDFIGCYMIDCSEYLKVSCHEKVVYMKKVIKKLRKCVFSKGS